MMMMMMMMIMMSRMLYMKDNYKKKIAPFKYDSVRKIGIDAFR